MHPFVRKLRHGAALTQDDEAVLRGLASSVRNVHARSDIVLEGDAPRSITLVLEGWACSYRELENGKRQIIALLLPGDLAEPFGILPGYCDHSLGALTDVKLAQVSPEKIRAAAKASARLEQALWWDLLVAGAVEREHVVSLGRRSAAERLGHLFCELHLRLAMVGLVQGGACDMPLTQVDLADALGLSPVHLNRSLQELRANRFVSLRGRRLILHDIEGLREASFFQPSYLHADEASRGAVLATVHG